LGKSIQDVQDELKEMYMMKEKRGEYKKRALGFSYPVHLFSYPDHHVLIFYFGFIFHPRLLLLCASTDVL